MTKFYIAHDPEFNSWVLRNDLTGETYCFEDEDMIVGGDITVGYSTREKAEAAMNRENAKEE